VSLGLPGAPWPPWWVPTTGALLGVGAHVANVVPDLADDLATGVRGAPHRLGLRGAQLVAPLPLAAASLVLVLGPTGSVDPVGWAVVAATVALLVAVIVPAPARTRRPFLATIAIATLDVALLLYRSAAG